MGLDSRFVPPHVASKVADPAERKRLGGTPEERRAKYEAGLERKFQAEVCGFCRRHNLVPCHSDPTKKSTYTKGAPDLIIFGRGLCLPLELKVGYNKLTPDQIEFQRALNAAGNEMRVAYDLQSALFIIAEFFDLKLELREWI